MKYLLEYNNINFNDWDDEETPNGIFTLYDRLEKYEKIPIKVLLDEFDDFCNLFQKKYYLKIKKIKVHLHECKNYIFIFIQLNSIRNYVTYVPDHRNGNKNSGINYIKDSNYKDYFDFNKKIFISI